jgi:hypothetical protein
MNAIISTLKNKQTQCRFCHQLILNEAGAIALRDDAQTLQGRFSSEDDTNDYFILVVIERYLLIALHGFRGKIKEEQG